jgi:hypothetical protein
MQKVISIDGTEIAFERLGRGPALIIVGGSLADHRFYVPLANELSRHFMVYNYDRRGRGQSGDTSAYTVERELEDLAALVDHAREPVFVYGHRLARRWPSGRRSMAQVSQGWFLPIRRSPHIARTTRSPRLSSPRKLPAYGS